MSGIKGKRYIDENGNEVLTGGLKASKTNRLLHGEDFYKRIGRKGGCVLGKAGGFASNKIGADGLTGRERAKLAGAIGGHISKRGKAKKEE